VACVAAIFQFDVDDLKLFPHTALLALYKLHANMSVLFKLNMSSNGGNIIFFVLVISVVFLVAVLITNENDERYFRDDVWSKSACSSIESENAVNPHPCYLIGSDGQCPLTVSHYTEINYTSSETTITYHMLSPENTNYKAAFEHEVDLLLNCHSIQFDKLIADYGQPYIVLLDNYKGSKWATYTGGAGGCNYDKRIVFPTRNHLSHNGVLIHEFAHYFQDILPSMAPNYYIKNECDKNLYETIVPTKEDTLTWARHGKYNDIKYGDGTGWPYCYGLSDGSEGVPSRVELMAILTEGACAESSSDSRYDRVCGPSAEYLKFVSHVIGSHGEEPYQKQHVCLEQLYGNDYFISANSDDSG